MIFQFLFALFVVACESKVLTVHPKYAQRKAPLELKSGFIPSEAQGDAKSRSKRYYWDDHNADYASKIQLNKV